MDISTSGDKHHYFFLGALIAIIGGVIYCVFKSNVDTKSDNNDKSGEEVKSDAKSKPKIPSLPEFEALGPVKRDANGLIEYSYFIKLH